MDNEIYYCPNCRWRTAYMVLVGTGLLKTCPRCGTAVVVTKPGETPAVGIPLKKAS